MAEAEARSVQRELPEPVPDPQPGPDPQPNPTPNPTPNPDPVPEPEPLPGRSRLGGLWVLLTSGAVILVVLLVFVLQNGQHVQIHLYGAHWDAPLGVALLMAAALGVLLVLVPGAGRIIQLRRSAKRLHQDRERLSARLDEVQQAPDAAQGPDGGGGGER